MWYLFVCVFQQSVLRLSNFAPVYRLYFIWQWSCFARKRIGFSGKGVRSKAWFNNVRGPRVQARSLLFDFITLRLLNNLSNPCSGSLVLSSYISYRIFPFFSLRLKNCPLEVVSKRQDQNWINKIHAVFAHWFEDLKQFSLSNRKTLSSCHY